MPETNTQVEVYEPGELQQRELTVDALVERQDKIKDAMHRAMTKGVHYGRIPGVSKPTLFKAGAEKLCTLFMFDPEYESETTLIEDTGHFHVKTKCILFHIPTGNRVASGEGYCTTEEKRYAEVGQKGSKKPRPRNELPEVYNTIVKMANKRALVAAVLNATAASDVFTQDMEDVEPPAPKSTKLTTKTKADLQRELTLNAYAPSVWSEQQALVNAQAFFQDPEITSLDDLSEERAQAIIQFARDWREEHPPPQPEEEYLADQEELS